MTIEEVIAYAIKHTPQANAVIAALASKGYVIVPREATDKMIEAGWSDGRSGSMWESYRRMIDAAPSPIRSSDS